MKLTTAFIKKHLVLYNRFVKDQLAIKGMAKMKKAQLEKEFNNRFKLFTGQVSGRTGYIPKDLLGFTPDYDEKVFYKAYEDFMKKSDPKVEKKKKSAPAKAVPKKEEPKLSNPKTQEEKNQVASLIDYMNKGFKIKGSDFTSGKDLMETVNSLRFSRDQLKRNGELVKALERFDKGLPQKKEKSAPAKAVPKKENIKFKVKKEEEPKKEEPKKADSFVLVGLQGGTYNLTKIKNIAFGLEQLNKNYKQFLTDFKKGRTKMGRKIETKEYKEELDNLKKNLDETYNPTRSLNAQINKKNAKEKFSPQFIKEVGNLVSERNKIARLFNKSTVRYKNLDYLNDYNSK